VDRSALPIPDQARPEVKESYIAPRTPVEEALAEIWAEVLGVERVGIHDNFFELGGHSLLVTRVVSKIRSFFQLDIPLRRLFEAPTVAGLAAILISLLDEDAAGGEVAEALAELEGMSDEEAERALADMNEKGPSDIRES
jgi:acyl carrier protein